MRKQIAVAILGISLVVLPGCSSSPCRQFFRGGACNSCLPGFGKTKEQCAGEYDGVSYGGEADCPTCAQGGIGTAPAETGEFIVPGGSSTITDPYSGSPALPGSEGLNSGTLPRPR